MKLYEVSEAEVLAGAGCTWCGVAVGKSCRDKYRGGRGALRPCPTHAQRWRDFWNIGRPARDRLKVDQAPWLAQRA